MNPKSPNQYKLFPKYRVFVTVRGTSIIIGNIYETNDYNDAISKAIVLDSKHCKPVEDYDVLVKIEVTE